MAVTTEKKQEGFTIIEAVVSVAIFAVLSLMVVNLFSIVLKNVRNNKETMAATSIALEKLETIRGMDYDNVKTDTGWVPAGPIPSILTLTRGGIAYTIQTDISRVDDPYDGLDPTDTFPFDYKKVRVRVSWKSATSGQTAQIAMDTNVAPEGLEGLAAGRGGLDISAFDANGLPIVSADVTITSTSQSYSLTPSGGGHTDLNGNLWVADLKPGSDYHIVVTKAGYSTAQTYAVNTNSSSPDYNPTPEKRDAQVIAQKALRIGFQIDVLGTMTINTVHFQNPTNQRVNFTQTAEQTEVTATATANNIFSAWSDTRDSGVKHIYMQKLTVGSGTYSRAWTSADVRRVNQVNASMPKLATAPDGTLWLAWSDDRTGDSDIYLQQVNTSSGATVGSEYKVNHSAAGKTQRRVDMAFDQDGHLYLVWEDNRDGSWDIYAQRFTPATSTFWNSDLKVNSVDAGDQLEPCVVLDRAGANVDQLYVAWQSNQTGNFDILLRKFDNSGTPAFAEKTINSDGGNLDQYDPAISFDGSQYLYMAWSDDRNSQPDIYLQKTDLGGNRLFTGDTKVNDDSYPTARRLKPSIAYRNDSNIYITWEDNRNGNATDNIYGLDMNSSGVRQWNYDLILTTQLNVMQTDATTVIDASGQAVTLWQDNRGGNNDIYGAAYSTMGNYVKANIPITVISQKVKGTYGSPAVGIPKYQRTFTSNASGVITIDASQGGLEWGSYTFATSNPYSIVSYDLPSPIAVPAGGSASVVININQ
jgi:type II secretory pathway pseudopilin PulG